MPARPTHAFRLLRGVLAALALTSALSGCRLGARKAAVLDSRLRPVATKAEFPDLKGDPAGDVAVALAELGVLEVAQGAFLPDAATNRADFITWLVRANDIFFRDQPAKQIRLASLDELPAFADVQPSLACFPYVQGMVNAGYVVGQGLPELSYDHNLTREWFIVLRNGIDLGKRTVLADPADYNVLRVQLRSFLKDADLVSDECLAAVLADVTGGKTIKLAFGGTDRLEPKRAATRREAILALSELGGRTYQQALKIEPKMVPLSPEEKSALEQKAAPHEEEHGDERDH